MCVFWSAPVFAEFLLPVPDIVSAVKKTFGLPDFKKKTELKFVP